jgi:hypothetical protein
LEYDVTFFIGFNTCYNKDMKLNIQSVIQHPGFILASWFVFVFFMVVILPAVSMATVEQGLTESIDTNFSFDPAAIYRIVEAYGPSGRAYYIWQRWTFDLIWPLVYGLPLFSTLNRFIPKLFRFRTMIVFLPLFATILDYLENVTFTVLVSLFPTEIPLLAVFGVTISAFKWFALGTSMMIVSILPIIGLLSLLRKLLKKSSS